MTEIGANLAMTKPTDPTPVIAGQVPGPGMDRRKINDGGNAPQLRLTSLPVREIDFLELDDGSLLEMIQNPEDPARTLLALWENGEVKYIDRLEYHNQILAPFPRNNEILRRVRLPQGTKPYESVQHLLRKIESLISRCVVLHDAHVCVLADFVLATWLIDRLPVAPYVSLVGLPQSGKTTLLKVLSLICRRSLLTADITSAAFYEACAQLTPTLLIDETGTYGSQRLLHHLLRMGATPDVVAVRKNRTFHAYGAKVLCWPEPPDDPALNSRCIIIPMAEANRSDLVRPSDPDVEQLAVDLQKSLLQFRLGGYKTVQLPQIAGSERLRPRTRDLLTSLVAPFSGDAERCDFLLRYFIRHDVVNREPLSRAQAAVLRALFVAVHHRRGGWPVLWVGDLTQWVNWLLARSGEHLRLQPRKVGAALTSLGFSSRKRTNRGWEVTLDKEEQKRVHELVHTYGTDQPQEVPLDVPPAECPLCKALEGKH